MTAEGGEASVEAEQKLMAGKAAPPVVGAASKPGGGGAPAGPGGAAGVGGKTTDLSPSSSPGLTIAISAIIAAIWAGLWGFDWAATYLTSGELFLAILIGLLGGILITYYVVNRSFSAIDHTWEAWKEVAEMAIEKNVTIPPAPVDVGRLRSPGADPRARVEVTVP